MNKFWIFSVVLVLGLASCNRSSIIGADIIPSEDNINVAYSDTISLKATTEEEGRTKVYDTNAALQPVRYMAGYVNDPVFGTYSSDIYTQFELLTTSPDFTDAIFDSVILSLAYDVDGLYGDLDQQFNLKVYEVNELMSPGFNYYSDTTFGIASSPLADVTFIPAPNDSLYVDSTTTLRPQIRVSLDNSFGQNFLTQTDSTTFSNDDFFTTNFLNGIKLEGSSTSNTSILSFDLLDASTKVDLHYTVNGEAKVFTLRVKSGSTKVMNFNHDYSSSEVINFIDDVTKGDSLAFIQSMEGLNIKVDMPYIENIQNIIVNRADLVVKVAQDADNDEYPLPEQLVLLRKTDAGDLVIIEDVIVSLSRTSTINGIFGGSVEENSSTGTTIKEYRMNISGYLQDVIDGQFLNNSLYISTYRRIDAPNRLILGGANHSQYPMKIELTYTKLD
jgi:hypothetical protein